MPQSVVNDLTGRPEARHAASELGRPLPDLGFVFEAVGAMMGHVSRRVSSTHMVGRAEELAVGQDVLRRVLDGANERAPQVLFIAGEAGIGKSRLLEELPTGPEMPVQ